MKKEELEHVRSFWWVPLIDGIAALLFGFAAIFWPGLTLVTLVYLFSAYILVGGIADLVIGITSIGKRKDWIWMMFLGLLNLGVGVYLMRNIAVSIATFILLIGFYFIVRGIVSVVMAFTDGKTPTGRVLDIVVGLVSVMAGVFVLRHPATSIGFVWVLGFYALVSGPVLIAAAYEMKSLVADTK